MKKIGMHGLYALLLTLLSLASGARAASIDIPDFEIDPGGSYTAEVNIDNGDFPEMFEYRGFQFDLLLPEGVGVNLGATRLLRPLQDFSVATHSYDGGVRCTFVVYTSETASTATEGLMAIEFTAAAGATPGPRTAQIQNVIFSSPKGQDIEGTGSQTLITLTSPREEIKAHIEIPAFGILQGGTFTAPASVAGEMEEMFGYAGFQFDLLPPEGVRVESATFSADLGGGAVRIERLEAGGYRIYSSRAGQSARLMEILFSAAADAPAGEHPMTISQVSFSTSKGQDIFLDDSSTTVTVEEPYVAVEQITLDIYDLTLLVGDSKRITATVLPPNSTERTVTWSVAEAAIATVDADGTVTGISPGQTIVSASCASVTATCVVTVTEPEPGVIPVSSVTVTPSELTLYTDDSPYPLTATVLPEDATDRGVAWESSDITVAIVGPTGVVTPVSPGLATVTAVATDGTGKSGACLVTVLERQTPQPPGPEVPETPEVPVSPIPDGTYGNANGTYVSALKIREGNELTMGINQPTGGYADNWEYLWTDPASAEIGDEREITTPALLYGEAAAAGKRQAISRNVYEVHVSDYDDEGALFWEGTFPTAEVQVYKRPQIPTQLLRKGDGTSCTFVVMMTPLSNQEILDLCYTYTYGYTDAQGRMHELETTQLRYSHTTDAIYNDASYRFWAYSRWTYPDGTLVTSGLRYLDGSEDPDFDASSIAPSRGGGNGSSRVETVAGGEEILGIYTIDGRYAGTDASHLAPGIYIIHTNNSTKKVKI